MNSPQAHSLRQLLDGFARLGTDVEVSDLTQDSQTAKPGSAFLAVRGSREHGLAFAPQAVANGARAVLWEPAPVAVLPDLPSDIVVTPVEHLREHASAIADRFFATPSASLAVAGITGTNGKTTCAYLLAQALETCERPAGYMGTIGIGRPGQLQASALTTGDAVTVQRNLSALRAGGARHVAMEVSSHALDQSRVAAVRFRTAAFTNLTRDHLDYHGTMDSYGAASRAVHARGSGVACHQRRRRLRPPAGSRSARPRRLVVTSRGHQTRVRNAQGFVRAMQVELSTRGIELGVRFQLGHGRAALPAGRRFQCRHLLTVIAVLLDWKVPLPQVIDAVAKVRARPDAWRPSAAHMRRWRWWTMRTHRCAAEGAVGGARALSRSVDRRFRLRGDRVRANGH